MVEARQSEQGGQGAEVRPYLSMAEAARLGPFSVAQLTHWMRKGTLVEGVHFTRPRNTRPLIVRDAFVAYLNGQDADLIAEHKRRQRRAPRKVNWDAVREVI